MQMQTAVTAYLNDKHLLVFASVALQNRRWWNIGQTLTIAALYTTLLTSLGINRSYFKTILKLLFVDTIINVQSSPVKTDGIATNYARRKKTEKKNVHGLSFCICNTNNSKIDSINVLNVINIYLQMSLKEPERVVSSLNF